MAVFIVMLTDAVLQVHDGTKVHEVTLKAGDSYGRAAGVQHDVMNCANTPMAFVEIESKRQDALATGA